MKIAIEEKEARNILETFSHKPNGSSFAKNIITDNPMFDLTVIVPVYNIENRLNKCINSILNQNTNYSYLIILIDDGSSDHSGTICDLYAEKHNNVIVKHIVNSGAARARNEGLKIINSKYIMFVDSDDYLTDNSIQVLLNAAFSSSAVIVQGQHYSIDENDNILSTSNEKELHGYPWGSVIRSDIFKNIIFPDNYLFEDTVFSLIIYPIIRMRGYKTTIIENIVYNYYINLDGSSKAFLNSPRAIETYWITELMLNELIERKYDIDNEYILQLTKQIVINVKRTLYMPDEIQKSIFVLSKALLIKSGIYDDKSILDNKLLTSIKEGNFTFYKMYCIMQN